MFPLDRQLTLLVNGLAGASRPLFELAMFASGPIALILAVAVWLALWWTDAEGHRGGALSLPGAGTLPAGIQRSRRRCVALAAAVALAFVCTRILAFASDMPRPLARESLSVPIDPAQWRDLALGMAGFGAFPSDHAALFFAVAAGLFAWSRRLGVAGTLLAAVLSAARVAIGLHYVSDVAAGGAIGAAFAAVLMVAAARSPRPFDMVVEAFERRPALLYPLMFVVAIDFTQHFRVVFSAVFYVLPRLLGG